MPATKNRALPRRAVRVRADSVDVEALTVEALLATEKPVRVIDYEALAVIEEVLLSKGCREFDRINLLNSHRRDNCDDVYGSVRNKRLEGDAIGVTLHFSRSDEGALRSFRKVQEGHLTDVSVGHENHSWFDIAPGQAGEHNGREFQAGELTMRIVTDWEAREGSLVPIGADSDAKIRAALAAHIEEGRRASTDEREENAMADESEPAPDEEERVEEEEKDTDTEPESEEKREEDDEVEEDKKEERSASAVLLAERARVKAIRSLAGADTPADVVERACAGNMTADQAATAILKAERSQRAAPVGANGLAAVHVRGAEKGEAGLRALAVGARLRTSSWDPSTPEDCKLAEKATQRNYDGMSVIDLCREALHVTGRSRYGSNSDVFQRAARAGLLAKPGEATNHGQRFHDGRLLGKRGSSTGTFAGIFLTPMLAQMIEMYTLGEDTTLGWVRETDSANFQENSRVRFSKGSPLSLQPRGGQAEHTAAGDEVEKIQLARYSRQFGLDEQDALSDNLGGFMFVPQDMAEAARDLRPRLVYSLLLANAALNSDSVALFDASTHGNLQSGGTSPLSMSSLQTALSAIAGQREANRALNLKGKFLIVTPTDVFQADQLATSALVVNGATTEQGNANPLVKLGLDVRGEAYIDATGVVDPRTLETTTRTGSAVNWFLMSSRPEIEVSYLAGSGRLPVLRSWVEDKNGKFGIGFDIHHDVGVTALGYRGIYKSVGA